MSARNHRNDYWNLILKEKILPRTSCEVRGLICYWVWSPLFSQVRAQVYERVIDQASEHLDWRRGHDT